MKSLLDTQILIWSFTEPEKIKETLKSYLNQDNNAIYVSCLSFYEIALKRKLGKLEFDHDLEGLIKSGYFEVIDLSIEHILYVETLPLIHRDPFDRMMIAQSIVEGIPLITSDKEIHKYDFPHVKA